MLNAMPCTKLRSPPSSPSRPQDKQMLDDFGDPIINFGAMPPLPEGWRVVQLDGGHYMATDGNVESAITVNRFHARSWAFQLAKPTAGEER